MIDRVVPEAAGLRVVELTMQRAPLTGERLPLLVAAGRPCRIALHWVLSERRAGVGSDTIKDELGHIAALYAAAQHVLARDLDALLGAGHVFTSTERDCLIREAERKYVRRRHPGVAGAVRAAETGAVAVPLMPAVTRNRLVGVWGRFLRWALEPANFRVVTPGDETAAKIVERAVLATHVDRWSVTARLAVPPPGRRFGLAAGELQALVDAVGRDADGQHPVTFTPEVQERNEGMLNLARWGGLRRGEILKLQPSDIGPVGEDGEDGVLSAVDPRALGAPVATRVRNAEGLPGPDEIRILRRPDDPDDTRLPAPKVKTSERIVAVPRWLVADLHAYVRGARGRPETPYLFVTADGVPLSLSGADLIMRVLGPAAAACHTALFPGASCSLAPDREAKREGLTWHRLRHTRAKELLELYRHDGQIGLENFYRYFGWASLEGARPYIDDLLKEIGGAAIHEHLAGLSGPGLRGVRAPQ